MFVPGRLRQATDKPNTSSARIFRLFQYHTAETTATTRHTDNSRNGMGAAPVWAAPGARPDRLQSAATNWKSGAMMRKPGRSERRDGSGQTAAPAIPPTTVAAMYVPMRMSAIFIFLQNVSIDDHGLVHVSSDALFCPFGPVISNYPKPLATSSSCRPQDL